MDYFEWLLFTNKQNMYTLFSVIKWLTIMWLHYTIKIFVVAYQITLWNIKEMYGYTRLYSDTIIITTYEYVTTGINNQW